jgi:hypothetical protein
MGLAFASLLLVALLGQAAPQYPPPYPRPGTTQLFDNEVITVWDVAWLKQKYPLHTHRYDLIGVSYVEGDRIITQGDRPGRQTTTKAWIFQANVAGNTHVEEGASDPPMRAVLMEVKRPAPGPRRPRRRTACGRSSARPPGRIAGPTPGPSRRGRRCRSTATCVTRWNWSSPGRRRR